MIPFSDVTILYQGGSGGFALFYYLLLSGQYTSGVDQTDVQSLIHTQFDPELKHNPKKWKHYEHWPDNLQCKYGMQGARLFLICNPAWEPEIAHQNAKIASGTLRILLYTDIKTQLRLAYDKQAYWFTDISRKRFQPNSSETDFRYMRRILKHNPDIDAELANVKKLFRPHHELLLQDFLQGQHIEGTPEPNQAQLDFLAYWLDLQPPKSKKALKCQLPL